MKKFDVCISTIFVFLILAGCATTINTEKYRRIGVISVVGTQLSAKYFGRWAFSHRYWEHDTKDLEIAHFIRDEFTKALTERLHEAVPIPIDSEQWYRRFADSTWSATSPFQTDLRKIVAQHKLDAVVLFVPGRIKFVAPRVAQRNPFSFVPARRRLPTASGAWSGVGNTGFGIFTNISDERYIYPYIFGIAHVFGGKGLEDLGGYPIEAVGERMSVPFRYKYRYSAEDWTAMKSGMKRAFRQEVRDVVARMQK